MARLSATIEVNVRSGPGTDYEILDTLAQGDLVDEVAVGDWAAIPMEDGTIGWVARKYLVVVPLTPKPAPGVPAPAPVAPGGEPVWIRWARSKLGEKEVPGPGDNPEIASWYHLTTLDPSNWHDSTAWCAVFVNASFMLNNIKTIRSARAVDWLTFGTPVNNPQKGDVVVFKWASGDHHVALFLSDAGDRISVCGGNQADMVSITTYPKAAVMGYRRPTV